MHFNATKSYKFLENKRTRVATTVTPKIQLCLFQLGRVFRGSQGLDCQLVGIAPRESRRQQGPNATGPQNVTCKLLRVKMGRPKPSMRHLGVKQIADETRRQPTGAIRQNIEEYGEAVTWFK